VGDFQSRVATGGQVESSSLDLGADVVRVELGGRRGVPTAHVSAGEIFARRQLERSR
jgi:hypothetical protein